MSGRKPSPGIKRALAHWERVTDGRAEPTTVSEVARLFGVKYVSLQQAIKRAGLPTRVEGGTRTGRALSEWRDILDGLAIPMTLTALARRHELNPHTLRAAVLEAGLATVARQVRWDDSRLGSALRDWRSTLNGLRDDSPGEIARRHGIDLATLRERIRDRGWPLRKPIPAPLPAPQAVA